MTIEDLLRFLNFDPTTSSEFIKVLNLKDQALAGDRSKYEELLDMKTKSLINLHSMEVSQFWFGKFLDSR